MNRRGVVTRIGQRLYMGKKYAIEKATGYLVCTTGKRQRLHVAIWEHEMGMAVPEGCVIHHKDWVKTNNTIENLCCVTVEDHERIHNAKASERGSGVKILDKITGEVVYIL